MNILERIVDVYAPHICVGCGVEGEIICLACLCATAKAEPRCYRCKRTDSGWRTCQDCLLHGLHAVVVPCRYEQVAHDAVWQLKFGRAQAAADVMAKPMAIVGRPIILPGSVIVPAPTASSRVRARGYDQASLLAKALAKRTDGTYAPLLWRLGHQRQVGANRQQRQMQMHGAFYVRDERKVADRHIVLVDDVITTGATLEAAARVLLDTGALSVSAIAFARA